MHSWFYHYPRAFTEAECSTIIGQAQNFPESDGTVGHGGAQVVAEKMRRSKKRWLPRNDHGIRFMSDRLALCCLEANHKFFHLDVGGYPWLQFINAQFTTYEAENEGHYDWHEDNCWVPANWSATDRKLSCVLLLSDPASFEGGGLELERTKLPVMGMGDVVVFPSFARHRVTPLTKGTRHSIVIWIEGERLR